MNPKNFVHNTTYSVQPPYKLPVTPGSVLVNDFWTPPPINFVHDHSFLRKFIIIYFFVI